MREIPLYLPIRDGEIIVSYTDRGGYVEKKFRDVHELADFFKSNPLIGEHFKYTTKKEKQQSVQQEKPDPVKETMMRFLNGETVLKGYDTTGIHQCAAKFLIEKTSMGWVRTNAGKKYLAELEKGLL